MIRNVDGIDSYPSLMKVREFKLKEFIVVYDRVTAWIKGFSCDKKASAAVPKYTVIE
jgi:hypothetical protein